MPWNGIGTFVLDPAFSPEVNGNIIDAVRYNGLFTDLAEGLTDALAKNGENVPIANLPMGGYKHTGAAAATAAGQYITWEQAIGLGLAAGIIPKRRVSGVTTITPDDTGYSVMHLSADTTPRTWTVQPNATAAYADGAAITFEVQPGAGAITLTFTDDVYFAVDGDTGSRTLAEFATATMLWDATAERWVISGTGVS